jgi:transposase
MNDRQPLYHLADRLKKRHGVDCSRTSMANWLIKLIKPLQPLFNLMKDEVISYDIAGYDATNLQVLKEPGRLPTTKSYIYCTRGGSPSKKVILYDYNYEEHKKYTKDWFAGFKGYIHMDADPFFEDLVAMPDIQANYCNAHSRRKFEPIAKMAKRKGLAKQALAFYKKLYKIESRAKREKLTLQSATY